MLVDSSRIKTIVDESDELEVDYYVSNRKDNVSEINVHRVQVWAEDQDRWIDITYNYNSDIQERINKMIAKDMISDSHFEATI